MKIIATTLMLFSGLMIPSFSSFAVPCPERIPATDVKFLEGFDDAYVEFVEDIEGYKYTWRSDLVPIEDASATSGGVSITDNTDSKLMCKYKVFFHNEAEEKKSINVKVYLKNIAEFYPTKLNYKDARKYLVEYRKGEHPTKSQWGNTWTLKTLHLVKGKIGYYDEIDEVKFVGNSPLTPNEKGGATVLTYMNFISLGEPGYTLRAVFSSDILHED